MTHKGDFSGDCRGAAVGNMETDPAPSTMEFVARWDGSFGVRGAGIGVTIEEAHSG